VVIGIGSQLNKTLLRHVFTCEKPVRKSKQKIQSGYLAAGLWIGTEGRQGRAQRHLVVSVLILGLSGGFRDVHEIIRQWAGRGGSCLQSQLPER
jgi:hypothetical protein